MAVLYRIAVDEVPSRRRRSDSSTRAASSGSPSRRRYSRGGRRRALADASIAATASVRDAILVHGDPEFARARHVRQENLRR
jgi:predicted nucleic acid-binding protein